MPSDTITIPKTEYETLQKIAERYTLARKLFVGEVFEEPPTKDVNRILQELRATGEYNDTFLKSMEEGMRDSRYFAEA